jgi:modulator of FtsH protease HflK
MRRGFLILFAALLAGYLLTGVAQVRPGERAVVRRFGRVVDQPSPGLWIGLPWGMDRIDRVPVNFVQRLLVGFQPEAEETSFMPPGQMLSGDQNLVNIQTAIDYTVGDADAVVAYVLNRERVEPAIARATESAMAEWVAGHTVDEVLLTGKVALRDWLVSHVQRRIEPYGLGVRIQSASVVYLAAPDQVRPEFDRVMIEQSKINTKVNEARQEAERLKHSAQAEEIVLQQQADAYAEGRRRIARADADSFTARWEQYSQLRKENPDILNVIWWAEMGKLLGQLKTNGQVDVLDDRIGADGLDVNQFARPRKKPNSP